MQSDVIGVNVNSDSPSSPTVERSACSLCPPSTKRAVAVASRCGDCARRSRSLFHSRPRGSLAPLRCPRARRNYVGILPATPAVTMGTDTGIDMTERGQTPGELPRSIVSALSDDAGGLHRAICHSIASQALRLNSRLAPALDRLHSILVALENELALSLFAQLGMLVRFGLSRYANANFEPQSAFFPDLLANTIGCLIMGAVADGKIVGAVLRAAAPPPDGSRAIERLSAELIPLVRRTGAVWAPVLLGLRTGFCGSLTSFSSWNQSLLELLVQEAKVGAALAALVLGILLPLAGLWLGHRLALYVYLRPNSQPPPVASLETQPPPVARLETQPPPVASLEEVLSSSLSPSAMSPTPPLPPPSPAPPPPSSLPPSPPADASPHVRVTIVVHWLMLALLLLGFGIAAIMAFSVSPTNGSVNGASFQAFRVSIALVTAPPGALLRWKLGARLNGKCTRGPFANWPLGTLVANLLASAVLGVIAGACASDAFGPVTASYGAWYAEAMLQGLGLGFCGCLSTVSTWMNEVSVLLAPTPDAKGGYSCGCTAVSYALGTVGMGLAVSVPCFVAVKAAGS